MKTREGKRKMYPKIAWASELTGPMHGFEISSVSPF